MSQENPHHRWIRALPLAALAWLFLVALLTLEFGPNLPKSTSGWLLFVIVGPPLYILAEAFVGWMFSSQHGYAISPRRFSLARLLIAGSVVLLRVVLVWLSS